jgi:hypothetical protein
VRIITISIEQQASNGPTAFRCYLADTFAIDLPNRVVFAPASG